MTSGICMSISAPSATARPPCKPSVLVAPLVSMPQLHTVQHSPLTCRCPEDLGRWSGTQARLFSGIEHCIFFVLVLTTMQKLAGSAGYAWRRQYRNEPKNEHSQSSTNKKKMSHHEVPFVSSKISRRKSATWPGLSTCAAAVGLLHGSSDTNNVRLLSNCLTALKASSSVRSSPTYTILVSDIKHQIESRDDATGEKETEKTRKKLTSGSGSTLIDFRSQLTARPLSHTTLMRSSNTFFPRVF
eukprot:284818335_3